MKIYKEILEEGKEQAEKYTEKYFLNGNPQDALEAETDFYVGFLSGAVFSTELLEKKGQELLLKKNFGKNLLKNLKKVRKR